MKRAKVRSAKNAALTASVWGAVLLLRCGGDATTETDEAGTDAARDAVVSDAEEDAGAIDGNTSEDAVAVVDGDVAAAITFVGAGDIAECGGIGASRTAKLLDAIPGTVFTLGDNAYGVGSDKEFTTCYDPFWGRHKARTKPVPGNHDYDTKNASGYYKYFGAAAGDPTKGYYSYDVGTWHVIALNSNCGEIDGCDAQSPQVAWLKADLAANAAKPCTAALWHHPRYTVGVHSNGTGMQPIWETLYANNVELILTGHDHNYQRWAPLDAAGKVDLVKGMRSFVIGTGGKDFYGTQADVRVEAREHDTWGVVKFTLNPSGYDWEFIAEPGKTFKDKGTGNCH
ncbi:MAG: metallophosphoesterase [Polyangiaceae bacterium]|nr:metallophosphoesterase [Polyangiaceae bacterium]